MFDTNNKNLHATMAAIIANHTGYVQRKMLSNGRVYDGSYVYLQLSVSFATINVDPLWLLKQICYEKQKKQAG